MAVLSVDLHLPGCRSLKDRRQRLRPVVDRLRSQGRVSVAETGPTDRWQAAGLTVAVAASSATAAEHALDEVERLVWSRPDLEVVEARRDWLELD